MTIRSRNGRPALRPAANLRNGAVAAAAVTGLVSAFVGPARAQDTAGSAWPVAGVEAPRTELVLEAYVTIGRAVDVGPSDHGTRRFIPITGGRFVGRGLRGTVMPGGADWQLERPDGVLELHAVYSLETDDGDVIVVENDGIASSIDSGSAGSPARYLRSAPRFHAPQGEHDWLNEAVFVGTVTPAEGGGAVIIRVFQVLSDLEGGAAVTESSAGRRCTGVSSSVARLECYDSAFGRAPNPSQSNGAESGTAAAAPAAGESAENAEAVDTEPGSYSVAIVEVRRRGRDAIFVTDRGEMWVQNDGRQLFVPDVPFEAEIRPGALGSQFLVPVSGGRAIRVRQP